MAAAKTDPDAESDDTVTYQFEMRRQAWRDWTNTVPREEPLDGRLKTLIRQDSIDAEADLDGSDARLAATRIRVQAIGALGAIRDRDDEATAKGKLATIIDIADTLESA